MKCEKVECVCGWCGVAYTKRKDRVQTPDYCCLDCRKRAVREAKRRECETCGAEFYPRPQQIRDGGGKFCSNRCATDSLKGRLVSDETRRKISEANKGRFVPSGPDNPCFKGRWLGGDGYVYLNVGRTVAEHRVIAEQKIGRRLRKHEVVHHINHDKADNRPENLEVMTRGEHMALHISERPPPSGKLGESNAAAKLTEAQVLKIRSSIGTHAEVARQYGVTGTLVSMIRRRKIWTHVA